MHSNSLHSVTGMWYGDVPHGATNTWRTDLVGPPGLSKPSHGSHGSQGKRGTIDGPPGFLADRNRSHGQPSLSHQQGYARDHNDLHRQSDHSQRPHGRSHSARRSRNQGTAFQQSPAHFGNGNHHGRTPNRRNLTPVPVRSNSSSRHEASPQPFHPLTSNPPASKPSPRVQRAPTPVRSSSSAAPSTPEGPGALMAAAAIAKAAEVKPISAAAAAKLLEQAHNTPTQVVDNLNVTDQMAEKYHILQSEDGRTILFKKTPRGRRGGVKHRRKQAMAGEGIPEGGEAPSTSSPAPSIAASTALHEPLPTQTEAEDSLAADALPSIASPPSSIPAVRPHPIEPELSTPPQPVHPPRPSTARELSPDTIAQGVESTAAAAVASSSRPAIGLDAGMDDLMQELRELRAAKARAEEAQEQLTQQAQLLLQEKSQLVQQMAQKEKVIKNLEERLEFVQAECEDLRMATPNTFFNSLHEELDAEGVDSQTSAELHLLQALLSGNSQGAHGMGAEGAAAVAAAIAQGQDGYYILDTTAAKPADALQYFDEQQGSTLLRPRAGIGASRLTAGGTATF